MSSSSDIETLRQYHKFIRDDEEDLKNSHEWGVRLAKKYYDKLYKEYGIIDTSKIHICGELGIRWRTKEEVLNGKGTEVCCVRKCNSEKHLSEYEIPFQYVEDSQTKFELVKCTLCSQCLKVVKDGLKAKQEIDSQKSSNVRKQKKRKSNDISSQGKVCGANPQV